MHAPCVVLGRLDPDSEVGRGPRLGMVGDGVGADDEEPRLSVGQRAQQIDEVPVHPDPTP